MASGFAHRRILRLITEADLSLLGLTVEHLRTRSDFQRPGHRPPLENLPSLRSGRLENHQDLTLNLGLAWDLTTPISEAAGRMADFIPPVSPRGECRHGQLLVANQGGIGGSAGINMDWTALEPRIGAAWKVLGSDKTVVRGGFAIYHDSAWSQGAQGLWQNPPFFAEGDIFACSG